jgi:hypothetical protein
MVEPLGHQLGCRHLKSKSYNPSTNGAFEGTINMGGTTRGCVGTWTPCYL